MRTYNHLYKSQEELKQFLEEIAIADPSKTLVRVHSAIHTKGQMDTLLESLRTLLPGAQVVGCSTMKVILEGRIVPQTCLISVTVLEKASVSTRRVSCKDGEGRWKEGETVARELIASLPPKQDGFLLVFFPFSYSKIEAFVNTVNDSGVPVRMLGGVAYLEDENGNVSEDLPYVIEGDHAATYDMVAAYVDASQMYIHSDYVCGIEAVGKKSPIQCRGRDIETVDGIPAGKWYGSMLGEETLANDPSIAGVFPVVMIDGREIAYHVEYLYDEQVGAHPYRLRSLGELKSGSLISPGYFNPKKIYDQVSDVAAAIANSPGEALFLYDCQGRASLLRNCARWENALFVSTNASGALLFGEIVSRDSENYYANLSFVSAALSERVGPRLMVESPDIAGIQDIQKENVQMLNYLLMNASKDLNDELSAQRERMQDALFYNPMVGTDNQLKFLFERERLKLDKSAILFIENEKMLRLFSSTADTYAFLSRCYRAVKDGYSGQPLHFYSYHDTSLLVAAGDDVTAEAFEEIITAIHEKLNQTVYQDAALSYIAATFQGEGDPFDHLEATLAYATKHKLHRVRYDQIISDLEKEHENVYILWVIKEALMHKRIAPFFQMIHNNFKEDRPLFESLIRIRDESGKLYFPNQFLPVSKEYGLYDKLSEQMVQTVMEMFCDREVSVSINLNVQDLYNQNILSVIFGMMKRATHPENFIFELVESEAVTDYEYIQSFADRIHEYGGRIAIDDFGSGFSNLLHILRIGADFIKIDGEVVRTIHKDVLCRDFIEFMNGWCQKTKQALICEYVENAEIQSIMEDIGVRYSQGYHFSAPHPWGQADEDLVAAWGG